MSDIATDSNMSLPLMEAFYTIQGEGFYQGSAAYFIRLGGCDVGCHWCDVKESWEATLHPLTSVTTMAEEAAKHPSQIAVVTGGEPLMYDLSELCKELKKRGLRTHIETSGAYQVSGEWDWFCLSPKKFKEPTLDSCRNAHELKAIIYNTSDFAFAEKYKNLVSPNCKLFLQPEWGKQEQMLPAIIEYVKTHPEWQISLQLHKYMQIP